MKNNYLKPNKQFRLKIEHKELCNESVVSIQARTLNEAIKQVNTLYPNWTVKQ